MDWLSAVTRLREEGLPAVLITVAQVRGHAPRDAGAKMVISEQGSWGSVGGGNLEEAAVLRARAMIESGARTPEQLDTRLNERERQEHGRQCCGGVVSLLFEPLPARPTVAIFGVGHVGYELARILSRLEVQLHLVDSRSEQLEELRLADVTDGLADVTVHRRLLGEQILDRLPRGADVLIMTHDHAEDYALCDAALRHGRLGTVGLIGSQVKWHRFRRMLIEAGHAESSVARIQSPIGLPTIAGKEPAVIAISVAADLLGRWSAAVPFDKLRERESELRERESELRERESELRERESELGERESEFGERESELGEHDAGAGTRGTVPELVEGPRTESITP